MSQQYVLLRKENDLLNSLIGQSFNHKSKFKAEKILDEIHSKAEIRMIGKKALCYVVDKNEILGVGGSTLMKDKDGKIVSNLILDQFGLWLTGIFARESTATKDTSIKDSGGTNRTVRVKTVDASAAGLFNARNVANFNGIQIQIGSGTTAPARTDFTLETAFGTLPESIGFIAPSDPVYNSSLGNFKYNASISAGGSGTVNESILSGKWDDVGNVVRVFVLFRDIISPGQSFVAGQTIALEYTVQL